MGISENRRHTFNQNELPDWAIHEEDQDGLNSFFNEPADRGEAETVFTIPRGASDTQSVPPRPEIVSETDPESEFEAASVQVETEPESVSAQVEFEPNSASSVRPEPESVPETEAENAESKDVDTEAEDTEVESEKRNATVGEDPKTHEKEPPRRDDFARFHCIYESRDGQLALYEDEQGHLTAVNTKRFA